MGFKKILTILLIAFSIPALSQEQTKKFFKVIIILEDKNFPYVEFDSTFATDGSAIILLGIMDTVALPLQTNIEHVITGVTYKKQAGINLSSVIYVEIEDTPDLSLAKIWLSDRGVEWQIENPTWKKGKNKEHSSYFGFDVLKYF